MPSIPSIIKDTMHFLQKLCNLGYIPETAIIHTIDVVGLYPHIPHEEGLEVLRLFLDKENLDILTEGLAGSAFCM